MAYGSYYIQRALRGLELKAQLEPSDPVNPVYPGIRTGTTNVGASPELAQKLVVLKYPTTTGPKKLLCQPRTPDVSGPSIAITIVGDVGDTETVVIVRRVDACLGWETDVTMSWILVSGALTEPELPMFDPCDDEC